MTPGISPLCRDPARLIWNIYPLFAAHSIYPASSLRSSLLPSTFHLRQTPTWLCLIFTMCSAATLTNILTLPLSSRGDFNKANLRQVMPNFHQHVSCPTRGPNTLDHCYSQFKNAYKARSLPSFGKSDHAAIFLTPEYKQRLTQEPPVKREVTRWSSHSEAMLQAALDDVDWDMFRASSSDVSKFTDVAVSFVNTLTEQATETITVKTFPNQKPWVDRTIRDAVNKRTAAYNEALLSGNMSVYKALCYALRRAVSAAKHRYKERIESHFQLNDSRRMWQGLRTICACLWEQILRGGECRSVAG